jgi:phage terminase large subunit-like protein
LLKALMADPLTVVTRATTAANAGNLPKAFLAEVSRLYAGTRLGRQELDGELIEAHEGGFFSYTAIDAARVTQAPPLLRVVVAVDPPAGERGDRCGIVVAGRAADSRLYLLADATLGPGPPMRWARAAVAAWQQWEADAVVVEVNQGGAMVRTLLHEVDPAVPVIEVRATRGKALRAEPVAALYEQGRVAHAGRFPALEDELCAFGPDGLPGGRSPDRLDALVWALTHLAFGTKGRPRVRVV